MNELIKQIESQIIQGRVNQRRERIQVINGALEEDEERRAVVGFETCESTRK